MPIVLVLSESPLPPPPELAPPLKISHAHSSPPAQHHKPKSTISVPQKYGDHSLAATPAAKQVDTKTRVKFTTRIDMAVHTEPTRWSCMGVLITAAREMGKVWLSATNGRAGVAIKTDGSTNAPRIMPLGALPSKNPSKKHKPSAELVKGVWVKDGTTSCGVGEEPDKRFPPLDDIFPRTAQLKNHHGTVYAIDAQIFLDTVRAMNVFDAPNNTYVNILVPREKNKPWVLLREDAMGVIMPVNSDCEPDRFATLAAEYGDAIKAARQTPGVKCV